MQGCLKPIRDGVNMDSRICTQQDLWNHYISVIGRPFVGCAGGKLSEVSSKKTIISVHAVFSEELLSAFYIATSKDCPEIHPTMQKYLLLDTI